MKTSNGRRNFAIAQRNLGRRRVDSFDSYKYKIKNTTGYGLNSLVDFEDIIDIINHLFIGSEGTLGFVSEIVYNTVEDVPHKGCGLMFFSTLNDASFAVVALALIWAVKGCCCGNDGLSIPKSSSNS